MKKQCISNSNSRFDMHTLNVNNKVFKFILLCFTKVIHRIKACIKGQYILLRSNGNSDRRTTLKASMKMHPKLHLPFPFKKLHPKLHHPTVLMKLEFQICKTLIFSTSQTYPDPKNKNDQISRSMYSVKQS